MPTRATAEYVSVRLYDDLRQTQREEAREPGRDARMSALAERQHGVVARRQLKAIGLGKDAIQHRIASGRLRPLHHGVYAVGHRLVPKQGWWMAAVLASGPEAVVSHHSAAALGGCGATQAARST